METLRADLEEADVLAAISDFARLEQALEAALQSASRIIQPSHLDFIRKQRGVVPPQACP
jgi:flagellin-like hook-associated protein FlgL